MLWNQKLRTLIALVALASAAAACGEVSPGPVEPERLSGSLLGTTVLVVEATIDVTGGTLSIPGGHSLYFPAGALAEPTTIRATKDQDRVLIEFGPHGLLFPESALPTLTLSYVDGTGYTDADADGLSIVYLGADGAVLEVLETAADTTADVLRARLRHFSTYAIATD